MILLCAQDIANWIEFGVGSLSLLHVAPAWQPGQLGLSDAAQLGSCVWGLSCHSWGVGVALILHVASSQSRFGLPPDIFISGHLAHLRGN